MRAGVLRHVIEFDEPIGTQDDTGSEVVEFTYAFSMRGSIEPVTGREGFIGQQINAEADTRLVIRWSPQSDAITPKWRARHGGIDYNVVNCIHVKQAQRELHLFCRSGLNDG